MRYDRPPTKADKKLRIRHEKDSVKFNVRHANDHIKAANAHYKKLKSNAPKVAKSLKVGKRLKKI